MADLMIEAAARNNVKLEVAENYHRRALDRFQAEVIKSGLIGDISRIYRIFYEGGYHGMSVLRLLCGGQPQSILGITHVTPIVPIIDRMNRHHSEEKWTTSYLEFDNNTAAIMIYSNVIHAQALGRKLGGISQIHGTKGVMVDDTVHYTSPADYENKALATAYEPEYISTTVNGQQVLERIVLELPEQTIVWENPYAELGIGREKGRGIDMADQLMSIANAVLHNTEPTYGAQAARLDGEMTLAAAESGLMNKASLSFPLSTPTQTEQMIHEKFQETYGYSYEEIEQLIDVWYLRR
ncbi:hypothetical protein KFU94_29360 [Chloroflexi bacterium TSY]|nr:hypothetical protein [Chloroflexi bacterium TSY]